MTFEIKASVGNAIKLDNTGGRRDSQGGLKTGGIDQSGSDLG